MRYSAASSPTAASCRASSETNLLSLRNLRCADRACDDDDDDWKRHKDEWLQTRAWTTMGFISTSFPPRSTSAPANNRQFNCRPPSAALVAAAWARRRAVRIARRARYCSSTATGGASVSCARSTADSRGADCSAAGTEAEVAMVGNGVQQELWWTKQGAAPPFPDRREVIDLFG